MNTKPESKFIRMAEVLPNNAKTAAILKTREEERIAKEEKEKAVSNLESSRLTKCYIQTFKQT